MDALSKLLDELKDGGQTQGNFLGFLHVLIGRTIKHHKDGEIVSKGMSWRDLAQCLKKIRWDPEVVREIGLEPEDLPPRDRLRFWYGAVAHAKVVSSAAVKAGDRFADVLRGMGYDVSATPEK